jgi:hypothetical protein
MIKLYVIWYSFALAATVVIWVLFKRLQMAWIKRLVRTGVIAFGFTTVPLGRDGEGGLFPMGLYYLARHNWLEAASGATLLIGIVWAILFLLVSLLVWFGSGLKKWRGTNNPRGR